MKEGWVYKKLGEICKLYQPKTIPQKDCLSDGKYPVYGSNGIIGYYNEYNHADKEILIACRGTCGIVNVSQPYSWINGNAMVVHLLSDILEFDFLKYQLIGKDMKDVITGAAIPQITRQSLSTILIGIPPRSLQSCIVSELDLLSSIIEKKKEQLKAYDQLAQSFFYDMFGDPIENEKGWVVKKFKDIGKIVTGNTPSKANPLYYNSSFIEWVKTDNIENNLLYATKAKEYLSEEGAKCGRIVDKGSLLVACIAGSLESIGKSCITDRRVAFNQQINAVVPDKSTCVLFLYHLIMSMKDTIKDYASTGMKHILTKSVMENITIPTPPLSLQQQFAEKIEMIERQKALLQQSITEAETLFNSRMDYYFN